MEPHSRPEFTQCSTLGLPLALVLLLKTALAGPTSDPVPQPVTDLAGWQNINVSAHRLIRFVNPLATSGHLTTSILVGMVKLAALCGFGSALWSWSKRNNKARVGKAPLAELGRFSSDNW